MQAFLTQWEKLGQVRPPSERAHVFSVCRGKFSTALFMGAFLSGLFLQRRLMFYNLCAGERVELGMVEGFSCRFALNSFFFSLFFETEASGEWGAFELFVVLMKRLILPGK